MTTWNYSGPFDVVDERWTHSRSQSPRSFWPVAGLESSGLVQHRKSAIHGLLIKSDWSRTRNECSAHTQKIGSGQSSRALPQARRIVGSGDENEVDDEILRLRLRTAFGVTSGRRPPSSSSWCLKTFARNFSNIDFFLKILPLKDDELAMSEM